MAQHKLVIAEKPSVAQSLAAVIGATVRKDGYLEGNGWRVSWCVGHLAGLADADSYDPKYAKWRYDDLPILPEHWQMVVGKDKKKQFDILKKLMNAPDVTEVVNACDAGREGEMIFRSVYELAGCKKPMKRLWISSMEDSAIREGFANLRPGADYDGLRDAALCRAKADWLVGTLYPMIYGLLGWGRLSVGAPYFNRATLPFALLMLVVIVLATFVSGKRAQLPALLAHAGVLLFAAGIVVSSVSRQEISLNLQPGQQVTLAGYTFRFERLDLQAKGNYTSEKAIVALFDHQQRIGELTPERRFYEARRQQMMEPSIRWNGIHDWYAVMGEKTGADRYAFRLYVQSGVRWIWGGGLLMIAGALLSGWRGRKRDE